MKSVHAPLLSRLFRRAPGIVLGLIAWSTVASAVVIDQQLDPRPFRDPATGGMNRASVSSGFGQEDSARAQTFTVGTAGSLSGVSVLVERAGSTNLPMIMEIRSTNAEGIPESNDANVLARVEVAPHLFPRDGEYGYDEEVPYVYIALETPIAVQAGDLLALTLRLPRVSEGFGGYWWEVTSPEGPDHYSGGMMYVRSDSWFVGFAGQWIDPGLPQYRNADAGFKIFIEPPIPVPVPMPTTTLLLLGLGLGGLGAVRRRVSTRRRILFRETC